MIYVGFYCWLQMRAGRKSQAVTSAPRTTTRNDELHSNFECQRASCVGSGTAYTPGQWYSAWFWATSGRLANGVVLLPLTAR